MAGWSRSAAVIPLPQAETRENGLIKILVAETMYHCGESGWQELEAAWSHQEPKVTIREQGVNAHSTSAQWGLPVLKQSRILFLGNGAPHSGASSYLNRAHHRIHMGQPNLDNPSLRFFPCVNVSTVNTVSIPTIPYFALGSTGDLNPGPCEC
jgi:hypothetical protein